MEKKRIHQTVLQPAKYLFLAVATLFSVLTAVIAIAMLMQTDRPHSKSLPKKVSYPEATEYIQTGNDVVVYIGRPSCQFCAIVSDALWSGFNTEIPIYYLSLEPYRQTSEYEKIKQEFGVAYIPAFLYFQNGQMTYSLNCPLDTSYYSVSGDEQRRLYNEMEQQIQKFLDGCMGKGTIVNEPLLEESGQPVHSSTTPPQNTASNFTEGESHEFP